MILRNIILRHKILCVINILRHKVRDDPKKYDCFLNKSLLARLKATTRQEASRRDRTDFTKTEKDIG